MLIGLYYLFNFYFIVNDLFNHLEILLLYYIKGDHRAPATDKVRNNWTGAFARDAKKLHVVQNNWPEPFVTKSYSGKFLIVKFLGSCPEP